MANTKHCLIVEIPGESPRHYLLSAERVTLGRTSENSVKLGVDTVSGKHCELRKRPAGYELVDLGSTNGTKLNGKPVEKDPRELREGDVVQIGLDVKATFVDMIEVVESQSKGESVSGSVTRKLKKPSTPAINPVAAAVARAGSSRAKAG